MATTIRKTEEEWRAQLTDEQFAVCRLKATERPFSGAYNACKDTGIYRCVCCDIALFNSTTKYESGTGWPSFWEPVAPDRVRLETDTSHGMVRIEVLCNACDAHLGHVFEDGPPPSGRRYCMNSVSLHFEKAD